MFFNYYFLKVHFLHFQRLKVKKKSQSSRNQGFFYYFCLVIEGSGSGSIPLTNGSRFGSATLVERFKQPGTCMSILRAGSWSGKRQQRSLWNGGSGGRFVQSLSESLTEEDEDEDYPTSGKKKEFFQYSIASSSRSIAGCLRTNY
jgi:hypothetical protein